jgi:hypothetical protein
MNHVVTVPPLLRCDCVSPCVCVCVSHENVVLSILTPQLFVVFLLSGFGCPTILQNYRLMRERSAHKFDDECKMMRGGGELGNWVMMRVFGVCC